jgi:hypothetical protein
VALDELGRGTATTDGAAIAYAVLHHLAHSVGCRGMFSTHYHRLADEHADDPTVQLRHMACKVNTLDVNRSLRTQNFLSLQTRRCKHAYQQRSSRSLWFARCRTRIFEIVLSDEAEMLYVSILSRNLKLSE